MITEGRIVTFTEPHLAALGSGSLIGVPIPIVIALAGIIAAADIMGADANNAGLWLELDAILAVVIGGTSLFGGRFSFGRTLLGALTLQALKTGILLAGLPPEFNLVAMALVVAVLLVLQSPAVRFGRRAAA